MSRKKKFSREQKAENMLPSQKKMSAALNDFVSALVEEELEPIRIDMIRIENELKMSIDEAREKLSQTGGNGVPQDFEQKIINEINDIIEETHQEIRVIIDEAKLSIIKDVEKRIIPFENAILDLKKNAAGQVSAKAASSFDDEKYNTLKNAVETLASRISEAFAEGFSEQEETYTNLFQELSGRVSALEKQLKKSTVKQVP
jgi:polyhydroxyalkanoate synthesis regulator phasin